MGDSSVDVIYQGAKCFWRTRITVDIIIVQHNEFNVLELITYEPSIDKEAPRIYLDNLVLDSKIDMAEVEVKLKEAKEPFLRRHEVPNAEKLLKDIITAAKINYVLNRVFVAELSPEKKVFKVEIQFNFRDHDEAHTSGVDISLVHCQKPPKLQPFKSPHYQTLADGAVDELLDSLQDDRTGLARFRYRAGVYEDNVEMMLTTKDRWRIPIIYAKVANGKSLTRADKKIWNTVTRGIKPEEARAAVASALAAPLRPVDIAEIERTTKIATDAKGLARREDTAAPVRPRTSNAAKSGRKPANATTPKAGNRSPVNDSSTNSFTAGFSAVTASMKRRLGLSPLSTEDDSTPNDHTSGSEYNPDGSRISPKPAAKSGKASTPPPAEFINPRGTNISITPKPRSYFAPARPKTSSSATRSTAGAGGKGDDKELSVNNRAHNKSSPMLKEKVPNLNVQESAAHTPAGAESNPAEEASTLTSQLASGFSAISASFKRSFAARPNESAAKPAALPRSPTKAAKGVHFTGGDDGHHFSGDRDSLHRSQSRTDRIPSRGASSTELGAAAAHEAPEVLLTPEEYRDRMIKKESESTARSFHQMSSAAMSRSDLQYALPEEGGSKKGKSTFEQFFSSMSPWSKSGKIAPLGGTNGDLDRSAFAGGHGV